MRKESCELLVLPKSIRHKVTGTFAAIIPATLGEGQTWDTTALYTDGILIVVGGEERPDEPDDPTDPGEAGPTIRATLAWGNATHSPSDGACTELIGSEESPSNNIGITMRYTNAPDKTYSTAGTPKFKYDFDGIDRTGIKVSNGAQNIVTLPENGRATKLIIYSVVSNKVDETRVSYWKEVAGVEYTPETTTVLDRDKTATDPNMVEFELDNVPSITFTNAGEQQAVVLVIEYHIGGPIGTSVSDAVVGEGSVVKVEYFTLSGERVATPGKGMYIMRMTAADGKVTSRKVVK